MNTLDENQNEEFTISTAARNEVRGTAPWLRLVGGIGVAISGLFLFFSIGFIIVSAAGIIPGGNSIDRYQLALRHPNILHNAGFIYAIHKPVDTGCR